MNITVPMILDRLFDVDFQYFPCSTSKGTQVSKIKFLKSSQMTIESNVLYLADLSYLKSDYGGIFPQNIACINDSNSELDIKMFQESNLILVEGSIELTELFNILNDSFCYYSCILSDLFEIVEENKGLQSLADKLTTVFGNPVSIVDRNLRLIAMSSKYKAKIVNEENYLKFYEKATTSGEIIKTDDDSNYLMENYLQRMNLNDKPVFFDSEEGYEFPMISYNLKVNRKNAGMFTVFEVGSSLTDATYDIIVFISKIISFELQEEKLLLMNDGIKLDYFYIDLLNGNNLSEQEVNSFFNYLDYPQGKDYLLMVVTAPMLSDQSYKLTYFRRKLLSLIKSNFCIIYEGYIVLIIESPSKGSLTDKNIAKFRDLLLDSGMVAGVSRPFQIFKDIERRYSEAKKAVELGLRMNLDGHVFKYEDFQFYHLIDLCADQEDIKSFCHPALFNLIEHHHELSKTLYLYLKNGKSQAKTAKELHIQRSSFLYRLRRIEEELGVHLDDYQSLLHIQLSYEILNYLNYGNYQHLDTSQIN